MSEQALGRVVATERRPNTPHQFHFWTAVTSPVGIGTIVRVRITDGSIKPYYRHQAGRRAIGAWRR